MQYVFDKPPSRINTGSLKWDCSKDELPMWVADMDFTTAPEIVEDIVARSTHGIFGYTDIPEEWSYSYVNWWKKRHNFEIEKERVSCSNLLFSKGSSGTVSINISELSKLPLSTSLDETNNTSVFSFSRNIYDLDDSYESGNYIVVETNFSSDKQILPLTEVHLNNPENQTIVFENLKIGTSAKITISIIQWMQDDQVSELLYIGDTGLFQVVAGENRRTIKLENTKFTVIPVDDGIQLEFYVPENTVKVDFFRKSNIPGSLSTEFENIMVMGSTNGMVTSGKHQATDYFVNSGSVEYAYYATFCDENWNTVDSDEITVSSDNGFGEISFSTEPVALYENGNIQFTTLPTLSDELKDIADDINLYSSFTFYYDDSDSDDKFEFDIPWNCKVNQILNLSEILVGEKSIGGKTLNFNLFTIWFGFNENSGDVVSYLRNFETFSNGGNMPSSITIPVSTNP